MSKISVGGAMCEPRWYIGVSLAYKHPEILPLNNPDDLAALLVLPFWASKMVAKEFRVALESNRSFDYAQDDTCTVWWMAQMAMAKASAASSGLGMFCSLRMVLTIRCICCLSALP